MKDNVRMHISSFVIILASLNLKVFLSLNNLIFNRICFNYRLTKIIFKERNSCDIRLLLDNNKAIIKPEILQIYKFSFNVLLEVLSTILPRTRISLLKSTLILLNLKNIFIVNLMALSSNK